MKIAAFANPSGSRFWRLEHPFKYLRKKGHEAVLVETGITEDVARWADLVVLQGCVDKEGIALLYMYQKEHGLKIVVDADDFIHPESDNPYKIDHDVTNAAEVFKITFGIADMITTTTPYLAEKLKEYNKNVVVLPNFMDMEVWDLPKLRNDSDTIRIGWAGSMTHLKDLEMVAEPLKQICKEFPQVRLIFVGDPRIRDHFEGYKTECMVGVPFNAWPPLLNGLRLDFALAPLRDTEFNRCKSNIKFLEYSIAQVPGIFSPTAYATRRFTDFDGKLGQIAENENQWYMNLRNMIVSKELRENIGKHAYSYVRQFYDLKKHVSSWEKAYQSIL